MDKKKLVLREIIAILITTGTFLILFFILGGWKLQKEQQYNIVTGAALINAVIAVIISSARVDILTSNAFFGAALTFSAVAVIALAASVSIIIAIIATSVFMVVLIGLIITAEAGEKFLVI